MKQVFVCCVMICSLLLAICGCYNDVTLQQGPELEFQEEPGVNQGGSGNHGPEFPDEQEPDEDDPSDIEQEEPDYDDPDFPDEEEPNEPDSPDEDEPSEPDPSEIEPPEFADF